MRTRCPAFDAFRVVAAVLVIANHTSPLLSFTGTGNFLVTRVLARVAVPFFLMVTGYYLYPAMRRGDWRKLGRSCAKLGLVYAISIALYLPLNVYAGYFETFTVGGFLKDLVWNGTFYHLWYLPAAILGLLLAAVLIRYARLRGALILCGLLYAVGLGGDSYYGLISANLVLRSFYDLLFALFDYTRNGLLLAPLFLVLGGCIRSRERWLPAKLAAPGFALSLAAMAAEALWLRGTGTRHDSMYVALPLVMLFLFHLLGTLGTGSSLRMRSVSLLTYIVHPWAIVIVRGASKAVGLGWLFIDNSAAHFLAVAMLSLGGAWLLCMAWDRLKPQRPRPTGRAWAEVDLDAVRHNAQLFESLLPAGCELMAVVKANAYGHGDVETARALMRAGVKAFAVATLAEGVRLREHGVRGDILVLGYTDPRDAPALVRYRLIASLLSAEHAQALDAYGRAIRAHIKLDTGMHRLGLDAGDIGGLEQVYACRHLRVEGLFSHLSVSDSLERADIDFTNTQLLRFSRCVTLLRLRGYKTGRLHIGASYGVLNYPGLPCHYARVGIGLFGVLSGDAPTRHTLPLVPALSVYARVACVRRIAAGEGVSYGRAFTAPCDMAVATVTIGYGDGVPRQLSGHGGWVLLRGRRAPIIGRVCMDQLCVDVTGIEGAAAGDVATIIGQDGGESIRCEDIAAWAGTIGNDIASRLGARLPRVYARAAVCAAQRGSVTPPRKNASRGVLEMNPQIRYNG